MIISSRDIRVDLPNRLIRKILNDRSEVLNKIKNDRWTWAMISDKKAPAWTIEAIVDFFLQSMINIEDMPLSKLFNHPHCSEETKLKIIDIVINWSKFEADNDVRRGYLEPEDVDKWVENNTILYMKNHVDKK